MSEFTDSQVKAAKNAVVSVFVGNADKSATTAKKARLVYVALHTGSTLAAIGEALTAGYAAKGVHAGIPSKGSLSAYAKSWEYSVTAGNTDDVTVARMFTTISATAMPAKALAEEVKRIGSLTDESDRSDALNALPTVKPKAATTAATVKGEGDDATSDEFTGRTELAAIVHGLKVTARQVADYTPEQVAELVAAWNLVAAAIGQRESVDTVSAALVAV